MQPVAYAHLTYKVGHRETRGLPCLGRAFLASAVVISIAVVVSVIAVAVPVNVAIYRTDAGCILVAVATTT